MMHARENDSVILKIESGEDVFQALEKAVSTYEIGSATIQWGIGTLHDIVVGYFNGREYEKTTYKESAEIVSFHGSIASNDPRFHIHTSFAVRDHSVHGGHLFSAVVAPLLEVEIHVLGTVKLGRKRSEGSGLKELYIL
ncbi:MAG: DUF296 domain-containing protein [Thermoplasmataceae archaeon]